MTPEEYKAFIDLEDRIKERAYEINNLSSYLYGGRSSWINKLVVEDGLIGFEVEESSCGYTNSYLPSMEEFTCPIEELKGIIQAKEVVARQKEEEYRLAAKLDAEAFKKKQDLKLLEELKLKYESGS